MSSEIGVLLVHIDFTPTNCFFDYFCVDIPLLVKLGRIPAYFPKFLLCYSLYSHFPQKNRNENSGEGHKADSGWTRGQKTAWPSFWPTPQIRVCEMWFRWHSCNTHCVCVWRGGGILQMSGCSLQPTPPPPGTPPPTSPPPWHNTNTTGGGGGNISHN